MAFVDTLQNYWDQRVPSERRMLILAAIAVPATLALWLGLKISDGLDAREARNADARRALRVLADLRSRGPAQPADTTLQNMPTEPAKLESYLDAAAKKVSVTIPRYSPGAPVQKNGFITHSTRIEVNDVTLDQLKAFLQEVETGNRYVAITNLAINRDFKDKDKVDARLEVSAYAKEPPAAPADKNGSGSAGKGG